MNSKEKTAYHEAGHALAMIHHKRKFEYVSIVPEGRFLGHVRVNEPGREIYLGDLVIDVLVLFAGIAAERQYLKTKYPHKKFNESYFFNPIRKDIHDIRELTRAFFKNEEEELRFLQWVYYRTDQKVIQMWGPIEKLAKALLKKPVITYEELQAANPILN